MGIAAYNRGTAVLARQLDSDRRPAEFEIMDVLNALPKYPSCGRVFGTIHFVFDMQRNIWWAECPVKGFGFAYKTLHEAVRRLHVDVVGFDNGVFIAEPRERSAYVW